MRPLGTGDRDRMKQCADHQTRQPNSGLTEASLGRRHRLVAFHVGNGQYGHADLGGEGVAFTQ